MRCGLLVLEESKKTGSVVGGGVIGKADGGGGEQTAALAPLRSCFLGAGEGGDCGAVGGGGSYYRDTSASHIQRWGDE